MKKLLVLLLIGGVVSFTRAETITVQKLQGEVSVRHGVTEVWTTVRVGDLLKPDDTIKTGKRGSAVILARVDQNAQSTDKRITLPAEVIVDMSDIRNLSPEELMLKLTMEKVRASSYQWKNDELHIPNATVVHGADRSAGPAMQEDNPETGRLEWNGARVLYNNAFYSTCALKSLELFRRYPSLNMLFENRWMAAQALEKADLRGEALEQYGTLLTAGNLTPAQESLVRARIGSLRK